MATRIPAQLECETNRVAVSQVAWRHVDDEKRIAWGKGTVFEVWHKSNPGLALVNCELVIVPADVLREVYGFVLAISDREAPKSWDVLQLELEDLLMSHDTGTA